MNPKSPLPPLRGMSLPLTLFYAGLDEVRQEVFDLRKEIAAQGESSEWRPMRVERIELPTPTAETMLTLLNEGIGPLIMDYEIVETIA